MSNSYRIRTQVGVDKSIKVNLEQDFEFLEILSLKILQSEIYTRQCADYGVVIGRISINNGFGLPNCKVSIFVPLADEDENNPIVSAIYPYKEVSDINDVGYRYNLLPYVQSYSNHVPTGSFFDKEDVLINQSFIQVFDKYYKYTANTNESGDFMIFGVPVGVQTIHVDVDLSDIGEFSLAPQDLIRTGLATEAQVSGTKFKSSSNLNELPQIVSLNRVITVEPLWGQPDLCNIGINRTDFDLSAEASVVIEPTAIFMGSMFSDTENLALKRNCRPKVAQGELCSLVAGPGEILAIRQTIFNDDTGKPVLEQYELESGGQVIDDNGTWLLDLPMNLDYVTTNEFGERVFSNDPQVGIPTRGKYRFKIKWNQSPSLDENVKRAYYLVPNVREYGWQFGNNFDPLFSLSPLNRILAEKSYAFSLDWNDYADPQSAIDCEDTFYQFSYNKVYTISQLIDQYRKGSLANKIISVKNILDNTCESTNNKFPTNDASFRWDFIFLLYTFASYIFRPILLALVTVLHVLYAVLNFLKFFVPLLAGYFLTLAIIATVEAVSVFPAVALFFPIAARSLLFFVLSGILIGVSILLFKLKLRAINLPLLLYDQCEFCQCADAGETEDSELFSSSTSQSAPPPALPNVSGIQLTNLEGTFYFADQVNDDIAYIFYGRILSGSYVQYPPNSSVCYSKTPHYTRGSFSSTVCVGNDEDEIKESAYFSTSLTLAERINLFNTKAKYYDNNSLTNPGGGVNRISVKIEPILNPNPSDIHYDNVICLLLTPDSLSATQAGTILTFVNPSNSQDINYISGITGSSSFYSNNPINPPTTTQITIKYANFNGVGNTTKMYMIPAPNSADTVTHKFPTDIEYFQVITAMTYSQYTAQTSTQLTNSLYTRILNNPMLIGILYDGNRKNHVIKDDINPILGLEDPSNQVVVFLNRGVDPYSSRVEIEYGLGRLFGFNDVNVVKVKSQYKLNIPIQNPTTNKILNVNHNTLTSNNAKNNDTYSDLKLYYETFDYEPIPQQYSAFTSNAAQYYSSLSNINVLNPVESPFNNCQSRSECLSTNSVVTQISNQFGVRVRGISGTQGNHFTTEFRIFATNATSPCTRKFTTPLNGRGYFPNEIVEGGSLMSATYNNISVRTGNEITFNYEDRTGYYTRRGNRVMSSTYFAPKYSSGLTLNYPVGTNGRQLVMRSDRLPTSDRLLQNCQTFYSLQQNQNLGIYLIPDEGAVAVESISGVGVQTNDDPSPPNVIAELIQSTNNCQDSRNLECYDFVANGPIQGPLYPGGGTYIVNSGNCQKSEFNKFIFENGCYKLITTPLLSLPLDLLLVSEWFSRTNINFGACRNIFSHLFTQNWVNGTLYAFAFKNNKIVDDNGNSLPQFCEDVIYYDEPTNNFYYRSSPYRTGTTIGFVGKVTNGVKPNKNNLLYPTTIIDLGPRSDYLQEIVFSDEYDGYVINQLNSTSYQDVSEMLNLLIINRLANTSFIGILTGSGGGSIFEYFTRVPLLSIDQRLTVDADYAQMISINSEFGVVPFEADNYPNIDPTTIVPPLQQGQFVINPVYFNTGQLEDTIFGIFYSSDTQLRDYITPKRTIINSQAQLDESCAFNNFYCYSQEVPFYQWEIKTSLNDPPPQNSIFGSQRNDWFTSPINTNSTFHSFKYQSMDRADSLSRYFRTNTSSFAGDFKGYIYSIDTRPQPPNPFFTQPSLNPLDSSWARNTTNLNTITVGAPFYFYFGLKKGASAWDRFAKKWINSERIQ